MAAAAVMATGASVASAEDMNMMLLESSFFKVRFILFSKRFKIDNNQKHKILKI